MAKITRKNLKLFAENSSISGQFGSGQLGTKNLTTDIEEIQDLTAWENGWADATIGGSKLPPVEELEGIQKVLAYQTANILQDGIPVYNADTTYYTNCIVRKDTTTELYKSLIDGNVGNLLTDGASWKICGDLINLGANITQIGTCSTAAATAEKAIVLSGYELSTGSTIIATFTNANTAATPTINVNSTGAKALKNIYGDAITYLPSGTKIPLFYDGTNFVSLFTNTNATMPNVEAGVSKSFNTEYTASADGWLWALGVSTGNQYLVLVTYKAAGSPTQAYSDTKYVASGNTATCFLPVFKGQVYNAISTLGNPSNFTFYPCKGGI
jgi:hypothetical protein